MSRDSPGEGAVSLVGTKVSGWSHRRDNSAEEGCLGKTGKEEVYNYSVGKSKIMT